MLYYMTSVDFAQLRRAWTHLFRNKSSGMGIALDHRPLTTNISIFCARGSSRRGDLLPSDLDRAYLHRGPTQRCGDVELPRSTRFAKYRWGMVYLLFLISVTIMEWIRHNGFNPGSPCAWPFRFVFDHICKRKEQFTMNKQTQHVLSTFKRSLRICSLFDSFRESQIRCFAFNLQSF